MAKSEKKDIVRFIGPSGTQEGTFQLNMIIEPEQPFFSLLASSDRHIRNADGGAYTIGIIDTGSGAIDAVPTNIDSGHLNNIIQKIRNHGVGHSYLFTISPGYFSSTFWTGNSISEGVLVFTLKANSIAYTQGISVSNLEGPNEDIVCNIPFKIPPAAPVHNTTDDPIGFIPEEDMETDDEPLPGTQDPFDEKKKASFPGFPRPNPKPKAVTLSPSFPINLVIPNVEEFLSVNIDLTDNSGTVLIDQKITDDNKSENLKLKFTWIRERIERQSQTTTRTEVDIDKNQKKEDTEDELDESFKSTNIDTAISLQKQTFVIYEYPDDIDDGPLVIKFEDSKRGSLTFNKQLTIEDLRITYNLTISNSIPRDLIPSDLSQNSQGDYELNIPLPFNSAGNVVVTLREYAVERGPIRDIKSKNLYFDQTGGATNVPHVRLSISDNDEVVTGGAAVIRAIWYKDSLSDQKIEVDAFTGGRVEWYNEINEPKVPEGYSDTTPFNVEGSFEYGGHLRTELVNNNEEYSTEHTITINFPKSKYNFDDIEMPHEEPQPYNRGRIDYIIPRDSVISKETEVSGPYTDQVITIEYDDSYGFLQDANDIAISLAPNGTIEPIDSGDSKSVKVYTRTASLFIPKNLSAIGALTIIVKKDAAKIREGNNTISGPSSDEDKRIPINITPITESVNTNNCTLTRIITENEWLNDVVYAYRENPGGSFLGVTDLVHVSTSIGTERGFLYGVAQIQKTSDTEPTELSFSYPSGAALFRVRDDCGSVGSGKAWEVLKGYASILIAARSLTVHTNRSGEKEIYFFEGSHHVEADGRRKRIGDDWEENVGKVWKITNLNSISEAPELKEVGLSWRSRQQETFDDEYLGIHTSMVSPIISEGRNKPLHFITGYGDLDSITTIDHDTHRIKNWNWIQYDDKLEPRISILPTNNKKGFEILTELASLTNSMTGFHPTGQFFFRPRAPFWARLNNSIAIDQTPSTLTGFLGPILGNILYSVSTAYFSHTNRQWPVPASDSDKEYLFLIDKEVFRYNKDLKITERGIRSEKEDHNENARVTYIDHILELNQEGVLEKPINDFNIRSDSVQRYNQIKITYGDNQDKEYYLEDSEKYKDHLPWAGPKYRYTVKKDGGKLYEVTLPLSDHQKEWVEWIARDYLEQFKDIHYLIDLDLKPTFHLRLGDTILLKQEERAHLFRPCQIYRVSHDQEGQTTTVSLRTLNNEPYQAASISEGEQVAEEDFNPALFDIQSGLEERNNVQELTYQQKNVVWQIFLLKNTDVPMSISDLVTEEKFDIYSYSRQISGMEQNLDYPELNVFTISDLTIEINDPFGSFSPENNNAPLSFGEIEGFSHDDTQPVNLFIQQGYSKDGHKARIQVNAGFENDEGEPITTPIMNGELIAINQGVKGGSFTFTVSDLSQTIRTEEVEDFGLSKQFLLEATESDSGQTNDFELPSPITPISLESEQLRPKDDKDKFIFKADNSSNNRIYIEPTTAVDVDRLNNNIEMTNVQDLKSEGLLDPQNYVLSETSIKLEGGSLRNEDGRVARILPANVNDPYNEGREISIQKLHSTFKAPYRYKKIENLIPLLLEHYNVDKGAYDSDTEKYEREYDLTYSKVRPGYHFLTNGRVGYDFEAEQDPGVDDPYPQDEFFQGFVTDFLYDSGETSDDDEVIRKRAFYFLYSTWHQSTRPRLVKYLPDEDQYEVLFQYNMEQDFDGRGTFNHAEFWKLATVDFETFYILGTNKAFTTGESLNEIPAGTYDTVVPTVDPDTGQAEGSRVRIWKIAKNQDEYEFSEFVAPTATWPPQLAMFYHFGLANNTAGLKNSSYGSITADLKNSSYPDTRKSFQIHGNYLYYIYGKKVSATQSNNMPISFGIARVNISSVGNSTPTRFTTDTDLTAANINDKRYLGFDFTIDDDTLYYIFPKQTGDTSSLIKREIDL